MIDEMAAASGARTQAIFRDVNERVREINATFSELVPLGDWVCECADHGCAERIALTPAEYEAVRAHPRRFLVAPTSTHVVPELEDIVDLNDRYWVVEKKG